MGRRGKLSQLQLLEEESTRGRREITVVRLFRRNTKIGRGCRQRAAPQEWRVQGSYTERIDP